MNIRSIAMFLCLLPLLSSCRKDKSIGEECQTIEDIARLAEDFEISKFENIDFLIYFTSNDSWGTYTNSIKIYKENFAFKSQNMQVLRNIRTSKKDTSYSFTVLNIEKIDSLVQQIDKLNCHPYNIDQFGASVDGNYHRIMYKNENVIKGWMWQDGYLSWANGARSVDSMKVKALALEGMLYRIARIGGTKIVYSIEHECINDSVKISIYPIWRDFTTQSVSAIHPKYKFVTNEDNYISRNIDFRDSLNIANELEIIVTTKENQKISLNRIRSIEDELNITLDAHKQGYPH